MLSYYLQAKSTQAAFSVGDRNALGAAAAFLTPVESIFKFLEDTVTVQINYSLAAGTKVTVNDIMVSFLILTGLSQALRYEHFG